jgi:osmoprotectant transport system permease protein
LVASGLIIVLIVFGVANQTKSNKITIGSKNFTESIILGNMLADLIEENTDLKVERKLNLGGTQVVFGALNSGDVDLYVEYTGTGLVNILKKETITNPQEVYDIVQREFNEKYDLKWLKPLGFNNTYAIAVRKDTAEKYGLRTISDLKNVSNELIMGPTIEFSNRPDGLIGLSEKYNLTFKSVSPVDGGLRYTAINSKKSDIIDAFSTDGLLKAFDLVVLEDDKNFFPPYYAVPLIRQKTLKKYPELESVINKLAGRLNDEKMRELNYRVDELKESPENVARDFLIQEGLIEK